MTEAKARTETWTPLFVTKAHDKHNPCNVKEYDSAKQQTPIRLRWSWCDEAHLREFEKPIPGVPIRAVNNSPHTKTNKKSNPFAVGKAFSVSIRLTYFLFSVSEKRRVESASQPAPGEFAPARQPVQRFKTTRS